MANCCVRIGCVKSEPRIHPPGRCFCTSSKRCQKSTTVDSVNRLQDYDRRRFLPRCPTLGHFACSTRFVPMDLHLSFGSVGRSVSFTRPNTTSIQPFHVRSFTCFDAPQYGRVPFSRFGHRRNWWVYSTMEADPPYTDDDALDWLDATRLRDPKQVKSDLQVIWKNSLL